MVTKRLPGNKRRELIIEAALEVFSERGYQGSTIKKIADRAGINQGLIYQHFTNKEDLYKSVIKKVPERFIPQKNTQVIMKGNDDKAVLKHFSNLYLNNMRANEKLVKFINFGQLENPQLFEIRHNKKEDSFITIFASYLNKRMKEGKFKRKKSQLAARIFVGIIHWYGLRVHIAEIKGWRTYDEEEVLDAIIDVYLNGLVMESKKDDKKLKLKDN